MRKRFTIIIPTLLVATAVVAAPAARAAAPSSFIQATPVVFDLKAKARDIVTESVTLANTDAFKRSIYAVVNTVSVASGTQEFLDPARADQSSSLANWIEITRGAIELAPGKKKEIPFTVAVNLRAAPGMYHAVITFADQPGASGSDAALRLAPAAAVNLEVVEDIKERIQLQKFIADKQIFSAWPVTFTTVLLNTGNRAETPVGDIRIYDQSGQEIAALPVNLGAIELAAGSTASFQSVGEHGPRIGKFKALLNLSYGTVHPGAVADTVFFWVVPWQKILAGFAGIAAGLIISRIFLRRR